MRNAIAYLIAVSVVLLSACGGGASATNPTAAAWTMNGQGNMVFDMPTSVARVRITGTFSGGSSNFIIKIGGRLIVNELLGTGFGRTAYDGTHLTGGGGVTEITNSAAVAWTFAEVR